MSENIRIDSPVDNLRRPPELGNWARKAVLDRLGRIGHGELRLIEGERVLTLGPGGADEIATTIRILDPAFYSSLVLGGGVGAAESYIRGEWDADDLVALVRLMLRNRRVLDGMDAGVAALAASLRRIYHWLRRNTTSASRRNIEAHYDLSNDFYSLFLDPTLAYSSAVFPRPDSSLEEGSTEKFDRLCRKLDLRPGDHLLEIGAGWGGFALHAVENYGCRVTTTTISSRQYEHCRELFARRDINDRVKLLDLDYRRLEGTFDKIVSIEMIEAVGHKFIPEFFGACSRLLVPDGLMALQGITISGQHYPRYIRSVDFIQRYVFPGSGLISLENVLSALNAETDLRLVDLEDITGHYARTLAMWRDKFMRRVDKVRGLGFSDNFIRLWEYYLSYCEGGFRERFIGDVQAVFAKPRFAGSISF